MVEFLVQGLPVAQGSMRAFSVKGQPIITSTAKGLPAWRRVIADAAQAHAHMHTGPVEVELVFRLPRPKALPKRRYSWATKRPDIDKLAPAARDALTAVMFSDDAQIVHLAVCSPSLGTLPREPLPIGYGGRSADMPERI